MKSLREHTHARQHELLGQYVHARTEGECTVVLRTFSRVDEAIVRFRERGQHEDEQAQRQARDATATFIAKTCSSSSLSQEASGDVLCATFNFRPGLLHSEA